MTTITNLNLPKIVPESDVIPRGLKVSKPYVRVHRYLDHMTPIRHSHRYLKEKIPPYVPEGTILLTTKTVPDVRKVEAKPLTNKRGELLFY